MGVYIWPVLLVVGCGSGPTLTSSSTPRDLGAPAPMDQAFVFALTVAERGLPSPTAELDVLARAVGMAASKASLKTLLRRVEKADTEAREFAEEKRITRIAELSEQIDALHAAAGIARLSNSTRQSLRSKMRRLRAERGALELKAGLNFSGLLTKAEVQQMAKLLAKAKKEVAAKKKAAAAIETTMDVAEIAVKVGGKFASLMGG